MTDETKDAASPDGPLALVPTQALLSALFSRYETAIFAGHGPWIPDQGLERVRVNWRGNLGTALLMATRVAHQINLALDDREHESPKVEG